MPLKTHIITNTYVLRLINHVSFWFRIEVMGFPLAILVLSVKAEILRVFLS